MLKFKNFDAMPDYIQWVVVCSLSGEHEGVQDRIIEDGKDGWTIDILINGTSVDATGLMAAIQLNINRKAEEIARDMLPDMLAEIESRLQHLRAVIDNISTYIELQ